MKNVVYILPCLLLCACVSVGGPTIRYQKWHDAIDNQKTIPKLYKTKTIQETNSRVNRVIKYKSDDKDYWQSASETVRLRTGDCEDYAIAKRQYLIQNGIVDESDIKLILVYDKKHKQNHALLLVNNDLVLDNQINKVYSIKSETFTKRYDMKVVVS